MGETHVVMFAAALAFYTALSLAPMLLIVMWASSLIGESLQEELISQADQLIGPEGGKTVALIVRNAKSRPEATSLAGIVSIATLLFAATAVFAQLQTALNAIWDIARRPHKGWLVWIRKRLVSIGMIVALCFVLMVSLIASTVVAFIGGHLSELLPEGLKGAWLYRTIETSVSSVLFLVLFTLIYKFLPDAPIKWRDVWAGGVVATVLFTVGKYLIGMYLGRSTVGSAYGAAGSLVVTLVWVYYSALIVLVGAEITRATAEVAGRITPTAPQPTS